jgi:hypothetical protein
MNERIKELSKQAGFFADQDNDKINKFAMLIVRECMRQVEEQYNPVLDNDDMMKDTHWDGYVQCGIDSYVAIREYFFGVE